MVALITVEDLWFVTTCQCHLEGIETELRVKAVRELPAEHVSGVQIYDRHQVEESLQERDGGDICRLKLVCCPDLLEFHQTGESLGWLAWHGGAGFLVNRMSKAMRRMRFRTRSRLIGMPSLARYSTSQRLPLQGFSR